MKSSEKHVFNQSAECLAYASLGDVCVRIVTVKNLADQYNLDYKVIPVSNPTFYPLWELAFRDRLVYSLNDLKGTEYEHALMHSPTHLDWQFGAVGFNVFESIYWESGFFETQDLRIKMLNIIPSKYESNAIFIYPNEKTDGNIVYDSKFWLDVCGRLKSLNYEINLMGDIEHRPLQEFYKHCGIDNIYKPTVDNLVTCIRNSSVALGGSTGPTWACLMSDIRQIVFESKRSPHGYWFFDRCQRVLEKKLEILPTFESLF